MPQIKFRKPADGKFIFAITQTEHSETISIEEIDREIESLKTRIKNRKALKKALQSFQAKNITEGEETFDPSAETAS